MSTGISRMHGAAIPLALAVVLYSSAALCQPVSAPTGWEDAPEATYDYWMAAITAPLARGVTAAGAVQSFSTDQEKIFIVDLAAAGVADLTTTPIFSLYMNGSVQFYGRHSLVRVVLTDQQSRDHLVYEAYPLITTRSSFELDRVCEETCVLDSVAASSVRIEVIGAALELTGLHYATSALAASTTVQDLQQRIKQVQNTVRINQIQYQNAVGGRNWTAGETPVSSLPFHEKMRLLGIPSQTVAPPPPGEDVPGEQKIRNLQGAEYYTGGVFELEIDAGGSEVLASPASEELIAAFDWRSRHGANNPNSPYYDGDPTGSGWLTSVKNQLGCGSCWAFAATGATEALVNLYFNQHRDLDLSEQNALSCSGGGTCAGGWPDLVLSYYTSTGAVDEACFPYTATDQPCANKCAQPTELIRIAGQETFADPKTDEKLKRLILDNGPISGGVFSLSHAMTLVGYETDPANGETIWIFKNSWGPYFGEQGYWRMKTPIQNIGWTHALKTPINAVISSTPLEIQCVDRDGDGFYNWGIGEAMPASCPAGIPQIKDCDDSDPAVAFFTHAGYCIAPPDSEPPVITLDVTPSTVWPPNHKMMAVALTGAVTDMGSGVDSTAAVYEVTDEYGRVELSGQVPLDSDGGYTVTALLEASRQGSDRDGRLYRVIVSASDLAGNQQTQSATIVVPHDRSEKQ